MLTLPSDPRLWPNQPGFWESLGLFLLYAYTMVAVLGDTYYTGVGISKGDTEMSPWNRWLFGKIGQAFTCFLEAAFVTFAGGAFAYFSMPAAFIFWGAVAIGETVMVIRNRKLLGLSL